MDTNALLILSAFVLLYAAVSRVVERSVLTPPIVFVGFGWLVGQYGLGLCNIEVSDVIVHRVAEVTLVIVLFTDASRISFRNLGRGFLLPLRMLAIGMPLAILFGTAAALLFFPGFGLVQAALLAAILAPTDAALGQTVVTSPAVPMRIRQTLNVESGLNDGLAVPVVMILIALAATHGEQDAERNWAAFTALQLGLGPVMGAAAGFLGGRLLMEAERRGFVNDIFDRLAGLAIAFLAYFGAKAVGGNGFIAAFVAGMTLGNTARTACKSLWSFAETEGQLLALLAFLFLGGGMLWPAFEDAGWATILYALLSLTVVRVAAIAISLIGARLRWQTIGFLGWFGPRGLASIVFALLVLEEETIAARDPIVTVVVVTVTLSTLFHGLSARPAAAAYGRSVKAQHEAEEHREAVELPLRLRHGH